MSLEDCWIILAWQRVVLDHALIFAQKESFWSFIGPSPEKDTQEPERSHKFKSHKVVQPVFDILFF